mgnify:CR=1 FL=1
MSDEANDRRAPAAALASLPAFFRLSGRRCVVTGGSDGAAWKAELLASAGARVEIYAAEPGERLDRLAAGPLDRESLGKDRTVATCHRRPRPRRIRPPSRREHVGTCTGDVARVVGSGRKDEVAYDGHVLHVDAATVEEFQPIQTAQQGGFATARRADDRRQFGNFDGEADTAQGGVVVVTFTQIVDGNERVHRNVLPSLEPSRTAIWQGLPNDRRR